MSYVLASQNRDIIRTQAGTGMESESNTHRLIWGWGDARKRTPSPPVEGQVELDGISSRLLLRECLERSFAVGRRLDRRCYISELNKRNVIKYTGLEIYCI